jgi:outer membrane protein assembly factor BamD (BamD/ComL family)
MSQNKGISATPEIEDSTNSRGKNYFLGIGINDYQKFKKLFNARKDVEDVKALLCQSFYFEDKNAEIIVDAQATRRNIIKKINELRSKITEDDSVLIYYSGHGYLDGKLGFWIPADAEEGEMADYISNADVREIIKEIPAKHILLISDSCFAASLLVRDASREVSGAFDTWEKNKSRWVFISGKGVVSDGEVGKNSPFATAIMKHLKEDSVEKINIVKLANDVINSVRFNYEQHAELSPLFGAGHDGGQFVFRKLRQELPDWTAACAKNTAAAYEAFLLKYPTSQFLAEAEKKITALKDAAAWQKALQRNSETAYLDYLQQFPSGKYFEQAKQRINNFDDERKWAKVKEQNTILAYLDYLELYPNGKYKEEARNEIDFFEKEQQRKEDEAKRIAKHLETIEKLKAEKERLEKENELLELEATQNNVYWAESIKSKDDTNKNLMLSQSLVKSDKAHYFNRNNLIFATIFLLISTFLVWYILRLPTNKIINPTEISNANDQKPNPVNPTRGDTSRTAVVDNQSKENLDWQKFDKNGKGTLQDYEAFLKNYPKGFNSKDALKKIEQIKSENNDDISTAERLIKSGYKEDAKIFLDKIKKRDPFNQRMKKLSKQIN